MPCLLFCHYAEKEEIMSYDEIKRRITARETAKARGYEENAAGFINCSGERTASLKLYDQGWHCFRCDEGGDVIDLLMHMEGMNHVEALQECARIARVELDRSEVVRTPNNDLEALRAAYDAHAAKSYSNCNYNRIDFRYEPIWRLYKAVLIGLHLYENTETMRKKLGEIGDTWDRRENRYINPIIDWLFYPDEIEKFLDLGWIG